METRQKSPWFSRLGAGRGIDNPIPENSTVEKHTQYDAGRIKIWRLEAQKKDNKGYVGPTWNAQTLYRSRALELLVETWGERE